MDTIDNLLRGLSLYTVRKTPKIFCVLEIYALSKCPSFDGSFHETPDSSYPRGQRWQIRRRFSLRHHSTIATYLMEV